MTLRRWTAVLAALVGVTVALAVSPALGDATNPNWHVRGVLPDDQPVFDVDASGPTNAWAVGPQIAVSFNGEEWNEVENASGGENIQDVSTNRNTNVWLFTYGTDTTHLVRYRIATRTAYPIAAGTWVDAIQATGGDAVWVAGRTGGVLYDKATGTPFLRRFNGTTWTSFSIPAGVVLNGFAARSDSDVWAFGHTLVGTPPTGPSQPVALHWNGSQWSQVAVPGLPSGAALVRGAIINSKSAWATGFEWDVDDGGLPVWGQPVTYRYSNGVWQQIVIPEIGAAESVASDGAGGTWLGRTDSSTLVRFTANGTWQTFPLPIHSGSPVTPQDLALIPGTKTTIGAGLVPAPTPPNVYTVLLQN